MAGVAGSSGLTAKQKEVAAHLGCGLSIVEAARASGVSHDTIALWLRNGPAEAMAEAIETTADQWTSRLLPRSLATFEYLLDNDDPQIQVQAAGGIVKRTALIIKRRADLEKARLDRDKFAADEAHRAWERDIKERETAIKERAADLAAKALDKAGEGGKNVVFYFPRPGGDDLYPRVET